MIALEKVTRRFGDRIAVDAVSFTLHPGEVFALLGPNGAGKTTTLRMLAGLIPPTSGRIVVDGRPLVRSNGGAHRRRIGLLTETPGLWDRLTARMNLVTFARLYGVADAEAAADRALDRFGLADRAGDPAAVLSKGMKQKLALARALVHDPAVVLLDEPTSGLDPATARSVRELVGQLRRDGRAVLVSSHNLPEVEQLADRIAVLQQRLVALDTPDALRARLFGRRVRIRPIGDPEPVAETVRTLGLGDARVENGCVSVAIDDPDAHLPDLIRQLVLTGVAIREVTDEAPPLEDVYLRVMETDAANDD